MSPLAQQSTFNEITAALDHAIRLSEEVEVHALLRSCPGCDVFIFSFSDEQFTVAAMETAAAAKEYARIFSGVLVFSVWKGWNVEQSTVESSQRRLAVSLS